MIIELPIYHHTDGTSTLKGLGLDYQIDDCDIRPITFYHINAVSPYFDSGKEYSSIHTNDSEYICPMNYMEVTAAILKSKYANDKPSSYYVKYQDK